MEALGVAASVIAVVDLSVKVASLCLQYSKDVKSAKDDIDRLKREVDNLTIVSNGVLKILDGPYGSRLHVSLQLQAAAKDGLSQLEILEEKLKPGSTRKAMSRIGARALKWPFKSKGLEKTVQDLIRCGQAMSMALQVDQTAVILSADQRAVIDRLPMVHGATYDSHAEEHNPTCHANTRVELLNEISAWVDDPSAKSIFWLNGMAGTGKSTVSRTVARILATRGKLGATFFFKRGEKDRFGIAKLATTIARQLLAMEPLLAPLVKDEMEANPTILGMAVREQFKRLIFNPLSTLPETSRRHSWLVIMVDALDECERDNDIRLIINLFAHAQSSASLGLKFLVTSRPDLPVRIGFGGVRDTYQDLILHQIPPNIVGDDILIFLTYQMGVIRDRYNDSVPEHRRLSPQWPGSSNIEALVAMAVPLFIVAATACRFISDRRCGNPERQLQKLLDYGNTGLESTYLPILHQQVAGLSHREYDAGVGQFRQIVGTIIALASPLSVSALAQLLNIDPQIIEIRLDMLHSVLSVPSSPESPIRLLHLSFRDFLVNPANKESSALCIDEQLTHQDIAASCLRAMHEQLHADMCHLRAPGTTRAAINAEVLSTHIKAEIEYCCTYWIYHLERTGTRIADDGPVYTFLTTHLLHWIEVLSLVGKAYETLGFVRTLQSLVEFRYSFRLSAFLDDAVCFIRNDVAVINTTPLQIYSSLLVFAPHQSLIRKTFANQLPCWIPYLTKVTRDWPQYIQNLAGHRGYIRSVAFSHDSVLILSASQDRTVRIWLTETGECVHMLEGHNDAVNFAHFSHNFELIVSGSEDSTLRIWHTNTGECVHILRGHDANVTMACFSHDSDSIASGSWDNTIRIWSVQSGECVQTITGHINMIRAIAFLPDNKLIASASLDGQINICSVESGECMRTLTAPGGKETTHASFSGDAALILTRFSGSDACVWSSQTGDHICILEDYENWHSGLEPIFSHDSQLVFSGSRDSRVRIWSASSGKAMKTFQGNGGAITAAALSRDSTLVAAGLNDMAIKLWHTDQKKAVQHSRAQVQFNVIRTLVISHDSKFIAAMCRDKTIQVWQTDTGRLLRTLKGHVASVSSLAFADDSCLIVSSSSDKTVRVWRIEDGHCVRTLEGHCSVVTTAVFSPDSTLILSGSRHGDLKIWHISSEGCIRTLHGHRRTILSAVFSQESMLVVSVSDDSTTRLWRTESGECVRVLNYGDAPVRSMALSFDAELIAISFWYKGIEIWRAQTGELSHTVTLDNSSKEISFVCGTSHLSTDWGIIELPKNDCSSPLVHSQTNMADHKLYGFALSNDHRWVMWNGENLLKIPAEFVSDISAITGSTLVLGSATNRVTMLKFSEYELNQALQGA